MPLFRRNAKQRGADQIAVRYRVCQFNRLFFDHFFACPPDKVISLVGFWPAFWIPVYVGQYRRCRAVPQISDRIAKRFKLVISQPFSKFE